MTTSIRASEHIHTHLANIDATRAEIKRIRREIECLHDAEREVMERLEWLTSGPGVGAVTDEIATDSPSDLTPDEYEHLEREVQRIIENA